MRWRIWFSGSAAEFLRKFSSRVRGFPVLCTYIHKGGLRLRKTLRGGHDMYDTARRVGLVKKRVREMTRRKRRRGIYGLSAMCMLLFAGC